MLDAAEGPRGRAAKSLFTRDAGVDSDEQSAALPLLMIDYGLRRSPPPRHHTRLTARR